MDNQIIPETIENILKGIEGSEVKYNEPLDLVWRIANVQMRENKELHQRLEEIERILGL